MRSTNRTLLPTRSLYPYHSPFCYSPLIGRYSGAEGGARVTPGLCGGLKAKQEHGQLLFQQEKAEAEARTAQNFEATNQGAAVRSKRA